MAKLGGTSDDSIHLMELLVEFMQAIDVTRRLLPKVPTPVLARVSWDQAVDMAQMLAGEATIVGKLWTGKVSDVKVLGQNMKEFFGLLQRLIMLGFGAIQGAGGVTLGSRMRLSMNRMTDLSVILIKEVVFSYDERGRNEDKVSKMIAAVWEAYFDMTKMPSNNATAIGEALVQATVLIKENLRVMKQAMERAASIEVKDKAADESGCSTEQQKEADSCDTPGTIKDEAGGDERSSLKELEDVKDEASVDDDSELKDTSSSDKNKESSGHQGWGFKDVASGNQGSSLKELEKGSVKDEAPLDDGSKLKDKDSVDDGSELKDEDSADEFLKFTPDEMTVDDLTSHAVSEVVIMLQELGQAMISLSKREDKGAVAEFVGSLENMVHVGSSLIKEAVLSKDSEKQNKNPKLTATLMEYSVAMMKSQRTSSNNITEATEALAQVTQSINETAVGESLCDLKNTPPNNADTELAEALASLSMKENTSKMEEQKEASGEAGSSTEQQKDEASGKLEETSPEDVTDEVSGEDESPDSSGSSSWPSVYAELTPEEITTAQIATDAISGIVEMMSLLGPAVSGLQFQEKKGTVDNFVASLEKILNLSVAIQLQTGELKMCVFHPQEISALRYAFGNIWEAMRQISVELHHVAKDLHFPPEFSQAWNDAVPKMKQLGKELDRRENQE